MSQVQTMQEATIAGSNGPTAPVSPSPQQVLLQTGLGFVISASLQVFVKLRLPDRMGSEPVSVKSLQSRPESTRITSSACSASWR